MAGPSLFVSLSRTSRRILADLSKHSRTMEVGTIRQYLESRLIDEMHIAISPILLGAGEHLFTGINMLELGYQCVEHVATARAMHFVLRKRDV